MGKSYRIGFALTVPILLGAFFLPWMLLRMEQSRAEERVVTVTENGEQGVSRLSLTEKQLFLANDTSFVILQETEVGEDEAQRLLDSALQELDILYRSGAVDEITCAAAAERGTALQVHQCIAINKETATRFYILRDENELLQIYLDADTEKILRLSVVNAWAQGEEMLWGTTKGDDSVERGMLAWAQYYGLEPTAVQWQEDGEFCRQLAVLSDEDGRSFVFCKLYSPADGSLGWQSIADLPESFADMIQEEGITDTYGG